MKITVEHEIPCDKGKERTCLYAGDFWGNPACRYHTYRNGWAIVEGPRCLTWHNGIPVSWEIRVWWPGSEVEDYPKHEDYGKTWFAYRRPPEGEEDT